MQAIQSRNLSVLDSLRMFGLTVNIWSARKKLRAEDLGDDLTLPPSELASLGSKRIIDPDCLKPFETLKRRAVRTLAERGIRFMNSYLIPEVHALEVAAELEVIEREFADEKAKFLSTYDTQCENWINRPWEKPEWREGIRRAITPKAVVASRIDYTFTVLQVVADPSQELSKGLEREVDGLSGQLFREVAEEADSIAEDTMCGATSVTQKTVNRMWKMHKKLCSLAFLNPAVQTLADYLEDQLKKLPSKGKLEGANFQQLLSLVLSLSDETRIAKVANVFAGASNASEVEEVFESAETQEVADTPVAQAAEVQVAEEVMHEPKTPAEIEARVVMAEAEIEATEAQEIAPAIEPEVVPEVVPPAPQLVAQDAIDFCL